MVARFLNCVHDWKSIHDKEDAENVPRWLIWINVFFLFADIGSFLIGKLLLAKLPSPEYVNRSYGCTKDILITVEENYMTYISCNNKKFAFFFSAFKAKLYLVMVLSSDCNYVNTKF